MLKRLSPFYEHAKKNFYYHSLYIVSIQVYRLVLSVAVRSAYAKDSTENKQKGLTKGQYTGYHNRWNNKKMKFTVLTVWVWSSLDDIVEEWWQKLYPLGELRFHLLQMALPTKRNRQCNPQDFNHTTASEISYIQKHLFYYNTTEYTYFIAATPWSHHCWKVRVIFSTFIIASFKRDTLWCSRHLS